MKLTPAQKLLDIAMNEGFEALPQIGLLPVMASAYYRHIVPSGMDTVVKLTSYIAIANPDGILAATRQGQLNLID